ncbi:MAG: phosphoribosylaminoimidazolesuccinocarboxamide synthase [Anaerolineae bacterium]
MITRDELRSAPMLESVEIPGLGAKVAGKVRDIYQQGDQRILITTDRVSAFDRVLGLIPYKGQVLNQLSLWWFEHMQYVVPHHVIASPDVNVTVAREAQALPVEVVVRGYITGVTSTSMWTMYAAGERAPYGIALPEGLRKNDRLPEPVITPTTKAIDGGHDERINPAEIVARGLIEAPLWSQIEETALQLFTQGQYMAAEAGLILVDTKYEFGLIDGALTLIDEIHTPDSSRYWLQTSYGGDTEPQHLDKEVLRQWFAARGYKGEGQPPVMSPDFIAEFAALYIEVYERLTGQVFIPGEQPAAARIARNVTEWMN